MANFRWHWVLIGGAIVYVVTEPPAVAAKIVVFVILSIAVYWAVAGVSRLIDWLWPEPSNS